MFRMLHRLAQENEKGISSIEEMKAENVPGHNMRNQGPI